MTRLPLACCVCCALLLAGCAGWAPPAPWEKDRLAKPEMAMDGDPLEHWTLRGPLVVVLAIFAFAITIRPFSLGGLSLPGLGMIVAGPLAIVIGGFAAPEGRLRTLLILAFLLTPFCMILFGDLLNLPIPVFPQRLADLFPPDWSQKAIMRAAAGAMFVLGLILLVVGYSLPPRKIDVVVDQAEGV